MLRVQTGTGDRAQGLLLDPTDRRPRGFVTCVAARRRSQHGTQSVPIRFAILGGRVMVCPPAGSSWRTRARLQPSICMHARSPSARPRADDEAAAIRDRFALAAVLITWLGMLTWALSYIRAFAPPFPIGDEFALYDLLPPIGIFSWKALWKLHHE